MTDQERIQSLTAALSAIRDRNKARDGLTDPVVQQIARDALKATASDVPRLRWEVPTHYGPLMVSAPVELPRRDISHAFDQLAGGFRRS